MCSSGGDSINDFKGVENDCFLCGHRLNVYTCAFYLKREVSSVFSDNSWLKLLFGVVIFKSLNFLIFSPIVFYYSYNVGHFRFYKSTHLYNSRILQSIHTTGDSEPMSLKTLDTLWSTSIINLWFYSSIFSTPTCTSRRLDFVKAVMFVSHANRTWNSYKRLTRLLLTISFS